MPAPLWEPGKAPYADYLKSLTPEEKEKHLAARRAKKSMRKAYEQVILSQQEQWLARINQGILAVLEKAIQTGDAQALATVYDRIIGKPVDTVATESGKPLPWNDDAEVTTSDDDSDVGPDSSVGNHAD